jgi:hypothetical protein
LAVKGQTKTSLEYKSNQSTRWAVLVFIFLFVGMFHLFLTGKHVLMSTDAVIAYANRGIDEVAREAVAYWDDGILLGLPRGSWTQISLLMRGFMPSLVWNNLTYGIACLAASMVLLFGFRRYVGTSTIILAAITAFWIGTNFTLIYAGHNLKPYVVALFIGSILAARLQGYRGGVIWGGITGLMFAQQPDVALFFALFGGCYLIFKLWERNGLKPALWLPTLLPALTAALLFAAGPLISGYKLNVQGTAAIQTEDPQEKWNFVTQWSFPPDEIISFIAPGYHGWRTGEVLGPYWGRTGQSAEWPESRQGYMNFMMESVYMGIIPFAFVLYALLFGRGSPYRGEIIFWSIASLVALLLSFGKHFFLYAAFYQLPIVHNIRNPNKFLQIFQVGVALVAMFGFDQFIRDSLQRDSRSTRYRPLLFLWILLASLLLILTVAISSTAYQPKTIFEFSMAGWPAEMARTIARNQTRSLWHVAGILSLLIGMVGILAIPRFEKLRSSGNQISLGIALLVALDAWWLSRHYVQTMPRSYIEANPLTDFLKESPAYNRVALLSQQGIYNIWLTYLLPYQRIPAFNLTQMPRMPQNYQTFLMAGSRNPLQMWRFSSVNHLLGPTAFASQLSGEAKILFTYSLSVKPDGNVEVIPAPNGEHAVFELLRSAPRFAFLDLDDTENEQAALNRLAGSGAALGGPEAGRVIVSSYKPGRIHLQVLAEQQGWLRIAERWDDDWVAEVNGHPATIKRIDFLCMGISLPPGKHDVLLEYRPSRLWIFTQGLGWILMAVAAFPITKNRL